jgi:Cys-tRNA(Pro)/Cys-tRNA(Cys) deacylase
MPARGTPAIDTLRQAGVAHTVHEYLAGLSDPRGHDRKAWGEEAAAALGVARDRVFKTLVVELDGRLVAAVVPVDQELDLKRLAETLGGRRAVLAAPAAAERASGSVVGGISPLAMRQSLPTVVDASASEHPTVFVSAGRRGLQLELAASDLVRLTGATVASLARGADLRRSGG